MGKRKKKKMLNYKPITLVRPAAIYNTCFWYSVKQIRDLWNEHMAIFKGPSSTPQAKINSWYHAMVLTDILRSKNEWDYISGTPFNNSIYQTDGDDFV
jgi:hypothetical protein